MINEVVDTIQNNPVESMLCLGAAGVFFGRRFCLAGALKIGAKISDLIGNEELAEQFEYESNTNLTLAKKGVTRDLSALVGFITIGLISNYAVNLLSKQNQKETGLFESYVIPVFSKVWNVSRGPALTAIGLGSLGLTWKFRSPIFKRCRMDLADRKFVLGSRLHDVEEYDDIITYLGEQFLLKQKIKFYEFLINLTTVTT